MRLPVLLISALSFSFVLTGCSSARMVTLQDYEARLPVSVDCVRKAMDGIDVISRTYLKTRAIRFEGKKLTGALFYVGEGPEFTKYSVQMQSGTYYPIDVAKAINNAIAQNCVAPQLQ